MFNISPSAEDSEAASAVISTHYSYLYDEPTIPKIVALMDAYVSEEGFYWADLTGYFSRCMPKEHVEHAVWLVKTLTGPDSDHHLWYRGEDPDEICFHGSGECEY